MNNPTYLFFFYFEFSQILHKPNPFSTAKFSVTSVLSVAIISKKLCGY
jgi:hypothetical protein